MELLQMPHSLKRDAVELLMAAGDYAGAVDLADQGLAQSGGLPELMVRKATAQLV